MKNILSAVSESAANKTEVTVTVTDMEEAINYTAPTYPAVWATLTRDERIQIRQLLSISAANADRFHRGDGADPVLADRANRAESAAHALWRGHGFPDLPTWQVRELVG